MRRSHGMPFGAEVHDEGVRFRLWAPLATTVTLVVDAAERPMTALGDGWFWLHVDAARPGSRYAFRINGGQPLPDPASRSNPDDVHGASAVVDPRAYDWQDAGWRGRPWEEAVIYELHVGSFTPAGTFAGVAERLDYLVDLGVTAIELMPVADYPGRRNWGYDGVLPYAPDSRYGRPDDLKRLIEAAHTRGLMVFLDVVYNHFGPDGNYLHAYAAPFFTEHHHTPWGAAIDFEGPHSRAVRDFFVHNALYWLEEYRFDGLRLDAIHAIHDATAPDIVQEICAAVRQGPGRERRVHIVLENDDNEAHYLSRDDQGTPGSAVAQWNDDIHHALHVLLTGEHDGYYADYAGTPLRHLGRCLAEGFAYQDDVSPYRDGKRRGERSDHLPPTAFVSFLQNHDQIGNRAFGERIGRLTEPAALAAASAILLLAPSPPLLFMGEEFAAEQPFLFFCDFAGDLATAVTEGRRGEFARFARFADPAVRSRIPDPNAEATFLACVLDWTSLTKPPHAACLARTRELLRLRRQWVAPRLAGIRGGAHFEVHGASALTVSWRMGDGSRLSLLANLGDSPAAPLPVPAGAAIYRGETLATHERREGTLPPWSVVWFLDTDSRESS